MNQDRLPKIDLTTFVLSVSSAACMGMDSKDLEMAKQNIDILELISEKTTGNRTPDEEHLLKQLLFEVRMKYVEATKGGRR